MQLIDQLFCNASNDIEGILWEHGKYWRFQLFTNTHGMNSISGSDNSSRKGCRKSNLFITTLHFNYLRSYTRGVATANQTS